MVRWDNFIEVFKGFRGHAKAEVSVLVPRDVELKLGVVTADALVAGLATDARLSTVSGDIVVDNITGDLDLNSVSGELSVGHHTGRIRANTVSGDVTASGDITRFSADGVSGNMIVDAPGTPATSTPTPSRATSPCASPRRRRPLPRQHRRRQACSSTTRP